jgi:hypothetical protein
MRATSHLRLFGTAFLFACGISLLLLAGCATARQVTEMEGRGSIETFDAPFERVWAAAVAAGQMGDLEIRSTDKARGYIAAGRGVRVQTFGEHVGIWVRELSPTQTQVEVVSRQAGPPKLTIRNWEKRILANIAANLTVDPVIR